jgi:MFS family permease
LTTLATAAPAERRGEAAGYYTSVTTSASIAFPALALWLMNGRGGFQAVLLLSIGLALSGLPVALNLARANRGSGMAVASRNEPTSRSLIERGVLLATGLNLCSSLVMPSVMAFLPLYARSLGIGNIGLFYVIAGITSIVVRPLLGRKSDAIGRGPAIGAGLGAQLIGLLLIVIAEDIGLILVGGFFVALGMAMISSMSTALAMDLATPGSRGRSMATFGMSFQIGAGAGALISGLLADLVGLRGMYLGSVVITLTGLGLLGTAWKSLPGPARRVP